MTPRTDPLPPRAVTITAAIVLAALCLGVVASSTTLWGGAQLEGWRLLGVF